MVRSEFGQAMRSRRRAVGITRSRLAARLDVPVVRLDRWEHGDEVPGPVELGGLASALGLDTAEAARWAELCAAPSVPQGALPRAAPVGAAAAAATVAVEVLPAARVGADPWDRHDPPGVRRAADGSPGDERRRAARRARRKRTEARALHRARVAEGREAQRAGDTRRRIEGRTGPAASPPPVFAPNLIEDRSHIRATVNRGSVFPVPASRATVDRYTYSTGGPTYRATPEDRMVYRARWMRVVLVLVALAALLGWAWAQLGDGWDAVIDLFRGGETAPTPEPLGFWWGV